MLMALGDRKRMCVQRRRQSANTGRQGEEVGNMGKGPEGPLVPFQESGAARNMNPFPSRRS